MWTTLIYVFERHTLLNKLSARRTFCTVSMQMGEKVLTYLNHVKLLAATPKPMGIRIDDQELAMAALNGLPASFESVIAALDVLGNDNGMFTYDLVKSRFLQEQQQAMEREAACIDFTPNAML